MGRLAGKVAAVTGGSTGLGAEVVRLYAQEGAQVVFGDIRPDEGQALVDTLAADGLKVEFLKVDVSKEHEVQALVDHAVRQYGRLDIMTANAGILGRAHRKSFIDVAEDEARELFEVNFMGVWWSLRAAIPAIAAAGGGSITVTGSTSADRGVPKAPAYAATKGAVAALVRSVAADLPEGMRINLVAPGAMATRLGVHTAQLQGIDVKDVVAQAHNVVAADPARVARVHLFLASDDSVEMNGQVLTVDGGATNRHP